MQEIAFQRLQVSKCPDLFPIHFSNASTATENGQFYFFRSMTPGSNYMCFRYFFHLDLRPVFHQAIFFARIFFASLEQIFNFFQPRAHKTKEKITSRENSPLVENWLKACNDTLIHRCIAIFLRTIRISIYGTRYRYLRYIYISLATNITNTSTNTNKCLQLDQ